jgi:hypothetical protein
MNLKNEMLLLLISANFDAACLERAHQRRQRIGNSMSKASAIFHGVRHAFCRKCALRSKSRYQALGLMRA